MAGVFLAVAAYFLLFVLLFRMSMADRLACVLLLWIIRAGVSYAVFPLRVVPGEFTDLKPAPPLGFRRWGRAKATARAVQRIHRSLGGGHRDALAWHSLHTGTSVPLAKKLAASFAQVGHSFIPPVEESIFAPFPSSVGTNTAVPLALVTTTPFCGADRHSRPAALASRPDHQQGRQCDHTR